MAAGPLFSSFLARVPDQDTDLGSFTDLNNSASVMVLVWSLFMLICLLFFKEPNLKAPIHNLGTQGSNETYYIWVVVLWNIFLAALTLEIVISSCPLVLPEILGWTRYTIGIYLGILNIIVLPVHLFIS
jgi:hypothetical protein